MPDRNSYDVVENGQHYCIRQVDWQDTMRINEYQRLRADIFVKQLGWNIPVDPDGREYDRYDQKHDPTISVHCVYGKHGLHSEHLLGGGRIFQLQTWNDSMVTNEFYEAEMIPTDALQFLKDHYDCKELMEFNRICIRRGRWYVPPDAPNSSFNLAVVSDLIYAAVYAMAEKTGRRSVFGIVDTLYLQAIKRARFAYKEIYSQCLDTRGGHAVIVTDLVATIRAIRAAGNTARADRMLALCANKDW